MSFFSRSSTTSKSDKEPSTPKNKPAKTSNVTPATPSTTHSTLSPSSPSMSTSALNSIAIPSPSSANFERVGVLTKLGKSFKNWRDRTFALSIPDERLYYFRSRPDFDAFCKSRLASSSSFTSSRASGVRNTSILSPGVAGVIPLSNAVIYFDAGAYMERSPCLEIATAQRRFFLVAESEKILKEWTLHLAKIESVQLKTPFVYTASSAKHADSFLHTRLGDASRFTVAADRLYDDEDDLTRGPSARSDPSPPDEKHPPLHGIVSSTPETKTDENFDVDADIGRDAAPSISMTVAESVHRMSYGAASMAMQEMSVHDFFSVERIIVGKNGWLEKRGALNKSYKKRFFMTENIDRATRATSISSPPSLSRTDLRIHANSTSLISAPSTNVGPLSPSSNARQQIQTQQSSPVLSPSSVASSPSPYEYVLSYAATVTDHQVHQFIPLSNCRLQAAPNAADPLQFDIVTNGRTFVLRAANEREKREWISVLTTLIGINEKKKSIGEWEIAVNEKMEKDEREEKDKKAGRENDEKRLNVIAEESERDRDSSQRQSVTQANESVTTPSAAQRFSLPPGPAAAHNTNFNSAGPEGDNAQKSAEEDSDDELMSSSSSIAHAIEANARREEERRKKEEEELARLEAEFEEKFSQVKAKSTKDQPTPDE